MAAWRQHICCTREAPDRRQCPRGFLGMKNLPSASTCCTACCSSWDATALQSAMEGETLQVMCSQAACLMLQSKTAEHKEHFGTYQDPRSKNEWEKAGDLRYGHHAHFALYWSVFCSRFITSEQAFPDPDAFESHMIMLSLQGLYCTFFGC